MLLKTVNWILHEDGKDIKSNKGGFQVFMVHLKFGFNPYQIFELKKSRFFITVGNIVGFI